MQKEKKTITIAIVDDHYLIGNAVRQMVENFTSENYTYKVVDVSPNGKEFLHELDSGLVVDLVILDINMPVMDGFSTAAWLVKNRPEMKILILTMMYDEKSVIRMLGIGVHGYLTKSASPDYLKSTIEKVLENQIYFDENISPFLLKLLRRNEKSKEISTLTEKEIEFIKLCCTEKTYKEISDVMFLSPRTVEALRDSVFTKLNTKTRVGVAMYAVKNGIYTVE